MCKVPREPLHGLGVSLPHVSSLGSSDAVCRGLGAGFVCSHVGSTSPPGQQDSHLNR